MRKRFIFLNRSPTNIVNKHMRAFKMEIIRNQCKNKIIWVDLEMTGLNLAKDRILEVASIITDDELNVISDYFEIVVHQSEAIFDKMVPWCQEQHNKTGLIDASRKSICDEKMAEKEFIKFLNKYVGNSNCPLAGNCIYLDLAFLQKYMPCVNSYFGHTVIDVASVNELAKRWNKRIENKKRRKMGNHRALGDIKDSIEELMYYKKNFFK